MRKLLRVCKYVADFRQFRTHRLVPDGNWLKAHPLPADKSSYGNFEALAQQNKQIIQQLLESNASTSSFSSTYDDELLFKLRNFYSSCLNEDKLDEIGSEPLVHFVQVLRRLYSGNSTDIEAAEDDASRKIRGLTAAIAYLHSANIGALFSFDIEGDVVVDPNAMVLWFSQPSLGLPSKVG